MLASFDVLVIGGGVIGLAIALELKLQGLTVTVLSQDFKQAAGHAAGGMLAPQAECIPIESPLLTLGLLSRDRYPAWIQQLEDLTQISTGYWPCGILSPIYGESSASNLIPPTANPQAQRGSCSAEYLTRQQVDDLQPGLGNEVTGGWWFPKDAQVDNRALMQSLWVANQNLGVTIQDGITVQALHHHNQRLTHVETSQGSWSAEHYVLATGAWTADLLPIPVHPRKGQMFAVQTPALEDSSSAMPLNIVLYGTGAYMIPRQTGQIVVGATSEAVGFTRGNTPAGVLQLLTGAIALFPQLQTYPFNEIWWGYRPSTPDELPILGASPYRNLTLATGHYRNGILLAPITALLVAQLILGNSDPLLNHFCYSRFEPSPKF
jgi:thiazole synthase